MFLWIYIYVEVGDVEHVITFVIYIISINDPNLGRRAEYVLSKTHHSISPQETNKNNLVLTDL